MSQINMSEIKEIKDPKVRNVALRVIKTASLALEKAVAHHKEPNTYVLPSNPKSLERIFLNRFKELDSAKQRAAVAKVMPVVEAPKAERIRSYGDLADVDLRSATEVRQQVKALGFPEALKFPISHLKPQTIASGAVPRTLSVSSAASVYHDQLECRIHSVKCIDETGGSFIEWIGGDDEIDLGGLSVDATGGTKKLSKFRVGNFNDGTVKTLGPKNFATFNLVRGTDWPKSYFVTFILAEIDGGGFGDFLADLVDEVSDEVKSGIIAAVGGLIGGLSGTPIGAAIGAAVGYAVEEIIKLVKSWLKDDVFDPVTGSVTIPSLNHLWQPGSPVSSKRTITFRGHDGQYQLTYSWRLFGAEAANYKSFRSYNYPTHYIRHRNYCGEITTINSSWDKKDATFKLVPGLAGGSSFESLNFPGYYLRHRNFRIFLERATDTEQFRKDASFIVEYPGLVHRRFAYRGGPLHSSFMSISHPGYYIRHRNFRLYLEKGNDDLFLKDASFLMTEGKWWA